MKEKLSLALLFCAFLTFAADASFELTLNTSNAQVGHLIIGSHKDATDGYDRGRDIYVPPFGMGTGIVGIFVSEKNPNMLYKDIRSTKLPQEWRIDCKPARNPIVVSWQKKDFPEGLQFKATNGKGIVTDMREKSSVRITAADTVTITVSPAAK